MRQDMLPGRGVACVVWALCACLLAGCGPSKAPSGTVSGKITLEGQPLTAGVVTLVNSAAGTGASAELDASGNYRIAGELPTGPYEVMIQAPAPPPPLPASPGAPLPPTPALKVNIPAKFHDAKTSGLSVTVKAGANTADFSL